jgi:hypothetical protein
MLGSALTETAPAALPFVARDVAAGVVVSGRRDRASTTAFAGVALLMLAAPFERLQPLLRLPAQSISNLEAALVAAFAAWAIALGSARRLPEWRSPLTLPWLFLIGAMCCATAAAPLARLNALHMTGRMAAAFGVYLLAVNGVTTRARLVAAVAIAMVAAAGVSVLAVLEYLTIPAVLHWLKAFRPQVMTVGALVRAGGSLQYPTIASMYLEIVFALGVGLLVASWDEHRRGRAGLVFATLLLMAYAVTLTFTRSGLILMAVAIVWIGVMRVRRTGVDAGAGLVALLGVSVLALFLGSRSLDSIWLRFTSEGQESWYQAEIEAPAAVALATGGVSRVPLTITNRGRLDWSSQASRRSSSRITGWSKAMSGTSCSTASERRLPRPCRRAPPWQWRRTCVRLGVRGGIAWYGMSCRSGARGSATNRDRRRPSRWPRSRDRRWPDQCSRFRGRGPVASAPPRLVGRARRGWSRRIRCSASAPTTFV